MHWGYSSNYGMGFGMGFGMIIWWIFIIALTILAITAIVNIIRGQRDFTRFQDNSTHTNDNSLNILKERFAKGEIDETEYEEKKKILLR